MSQEQLAEASGLASDTIRRLEKGGFSPSLDTLRKLCGGLEIEVSTLFFGYECGRGRVDLEILNAIQRLSPAQLRGALEVLRGLSEAMGLELKGEGEDEPLGPLDFELALAVSMAQAVDEHTAAKLASETEGSGNMSDADKIAGARAVVARAHREGDLLGVRQMQIERLQSEIEQASEGNASEDTSETEGNASEDNDA